MSMISKELLENTMNYISGKDRKQMELTCLEDFIEEAMKLE